MFLHVQNVKNDQHGCIFGQDFGAGARQNHFNPACTRRVKMFSVLQGGQNTEEEEKKDVDCEHTSPAAEVIILDGSVRCVYYTHRSQR